jgi:hypothetical protein
VENFANFCEVFLFLNHSLLRRNPSAIFHIDKTLQKLALVGIVIAKLYRVTQ